MFQIVFLLFIYFLNLCTCFEAGEPWYTYQNEFKDANREELVVKSVVSEDHIHLNYSVSKWKSLTTGSICYSVGLMENGIVALFSTFNAESSAFNITSQVLELSNKPSDVVLFNFLAEDKSEVFAVVIYYNDTQLDWINVSNKTLEKSSTSFSNKILHHANIFEAEQDYFLVTIVADQNNSSLEIYNIHKDLDNVEISILNSTDLPETANNSAIFNFKGDIYLAVPQTSLGEILIYKFLNKTFIQQKIILKSTNVKKVSSFDIRFRCFLAIDGYSSGIYEFTDAGFIRQNLVHGNDEGIHFWLPIPVHTYRDEVIILAERALEHDTHKSYTMEIIVNNGGKFEEHEDIPCTHYDEKVEWLSCLSHGTGIVGSSFISVNGELGIIVPQKKENFSEIFMIDYEVIQMPNQEENELEELVLLKNNLQKLIDLQKKQADDVIKSKQQTELRNANIVSGDVTSRRMSQIKLDNLKSDLDELGTKLNRLKEKFNSSTEINTTYDTIIIEADAEFLGKILADEFEVGSIWGKPANDLLNDIVNKKNTSKISGKKTFSDIEVENLSFNKLNSIKAEDIILTNNSTLILSKNSTFEQPLKVQNVNIMKINDNISLDDIVTVQGHYDGELEFDNILVHENFRVKRIKEDTENGLQNQEFKSELQLESVLLPENATVSFINRASFDELLNDMCLINVKCYIPRNLTVQGNIITKDSYTDFLNDLKYPDDYLFLDSIPHANITGDKIFTSLSANEIMTKGAVDKVDTSKLITLSTDQNIPGTITFENLELTEVLNVTGNITGDDMDMFLSNPTLNETNEINVNVIFKKIEVEGNIIIENNFNKVNFNDTLQDLVYKDENDVEIQGMKEFPHGIEVENLTIESAMVNNIKVKELVTKHEEQNLFGIPVLKGDVTIQNLIVNGTFNGYNISKFEESLVKLNGEQFIESTLLFEEELVVNQLEIRERLNDHKAEDYIYATGDNPIDWDVNLEDIIVENILIEGDFQGNIEENNFTSIMDRVLSYTGNQTIKVPFEIRSAEVDNLELNQINGVDFRDKFNGDQSREDFIDQLIQGLVDVENLTVNGPLAVGKINGLSMSELMKNPFKDGSYQENLTVEGDVYFKEVSIQRLSGVSWDKLLGLLILKNETNVIINGTKTFSNSFNVNKLIETNEINGVELENILTTVGEQDVLGPISIEGEVVFQKLDIKENLNQVPVEYIMDHLNITNNTYTVKGDEIFKRLTYIDNLILKGNVNNKNPEDTLDQIVYLNEDIVLKSPMKFHDPVHISGNMSVKKFNGEKVSNILSEIVYTDKPAIISSKVIFNEPVLLDKNLQVQGNLDAQLLFGLNTSDWLEKAIFVNKGIVHGLGNFLFENITINEQLIVKSLNKQNMSSIIDLNSNEVLGHMKFQTINVVSDIPVGNLVNGYKLQDEVTNTFMADGSYRINSNVIFKNVILVRDNFTVETINKRNASKLVNINTDQVLSSPFNFKKKCSINADLTIHGLLNGMNTTQWKKKNLELFSTDLQEINTDWNVLKNVTFTEIHNGDGTIENFNITFLAKEVEERRNYKYQTEGAIIETYKALCTDIKYLHQAAQKQLFKFKYFENLQEISFSENLNDFFYFEIYNKQYLFINEPNCMSHIFEFNETMFYPLQFGILTGYIAQVIPVIRNDLIYLVTRGSNQCNIGGSNIWDFNDNSLELKYKMEENLTLIQDSLVHGTFYGLDRDGVTEFRIKDMGYIKYRTWKIFEENSAFFPRGLRGTGLALRTGNNIIFLDRSNSANENEDDFDPNSDIILRGSITFKPNSVIPGRNGMDLVISNVGGTSTKKTFLAIAYDEITTVGGHLNLIRIYDEPLKGGVFQEIKSYKPSSLVSVELDQGETLLAFLEDNNVLQIYEYKGIEGFKPRTSVRLHGTKLISMTLPMKSYLNHRKALGIMNGNKITIIQAVMTGNRLEDNFNCGL